MSILQQSIRPSASNLDRHPATGPKPTPRPKPAPRPFGEGLTADLVIKGVVYAVEPFTAQDGTSVVRLTKQAGKGEVYNISRGSDNEVRCCCPDFEFKRAGTGCPCKHGAAVVEAGLLKATAPRVAAPAPVVAPAKSEIIADSVPANVTRIAIISGDHRQTFKAIATTGGRAWESDSGKTWLGDSAVASLYQAGRVAILKDTPTPVVMTVVEPPAVAPAVETPKPTLTPSAKSGREDAAWHFAFTLGMEGENAAPCSHWPVKVQRAFLDGLASGEAQRDHDEAEDMDRRWAECRDDRFEDAEYCDMGCDAPAVPYAFA